MAALQHTIAQIRTSEVTKMCFDNNCSCIWLIIILVVLFCCCGNQGCGCGNNCGCNNSCCNC